MFLWTCLWIALLTYLSTLPWMLLWIFLLNIPTVFLWTVLSTFLQKRRRMCQTRLLHPSVSRLCWVYVHWALLF